MRHGMKLRHLSRNSSHRRALLRSLATSLFRYEKFETTVQKAKELRPIAERLITMARKDTLAARRNAYGYILDKAVVHKLFVEIAPRFLKREGGYTRIVRTGWRHGDAAEMAVIELVERGDAKAAPTNKSPKKKSAGAKAPKAKEAKATKKTAAKKKAA